jgi:preprotein translocase subunit SecD
VRPGPPSIEEEATVVSTVTTTTVATAAQAGVLALVAVLTLLTLLIQKELTVAAEGPFARIFGKVLNVGILPLLMAFVLIAVVKVIEVLK